LILLKYLSFDHWVLVNVSIKGVVGFPWLCGSVVAWNAENEGGYEVGLEVGVC